MRFATLTLLPRGHLAIAVQVALVVVLGPLVAFAQQHTGRLSRLCAAPHDCGGVSAEYVYTGEVFTNMRGGISASDATKYYGLLDLTTEIDLDHYGWAPGGTFVIFAQNGHGMGITEDYVGDVQVLSNIDAPPFTQVSEYFWQREWRDGEIIARLGKQDCNSTFAVVESAENFINSSFGFHPTIPMPTYPDPSMAAAVWLQLTERLALEAGVWDGAPYGGNWGFSGTGETFSLLEIEYVYDLGGLPGDFHAGPWYHSGPFEDVSGGSMVYGGNHGFHLEWEQTLWGMPYDHEEAERSLTAFFQYAWTLPDRNELESYIGGGVAMRRLFKCRPDDLTGLGFAQARFSGLLPGMRPETAFELFYRAPLTDRFVLHPDLQYIVNPGGDGRDAFVFGLRFEAAL